MQRFGKAAAAALAAATFLPASGGELAEVTLLGQWDGFGGTYADVWGDGDFAYVGHFGGAAINIVDISDPTNPVGFEYPLPPPNQTASAQDVKVGDGLLFIGLEGSSSASCHIVDVRDPLNPVPVVDVDIPDFTAIHNVFYADGFLYMADSGTPQVGIVDLRDLDPDNPPASSITSTTWMLANVGSSFVHDVTVTGGRLYASAWDSGLWIYDVTNVATETPSFLGSTPDGGNNTHSCWPTDNGDYVVTGEERTGGGIKVYRITDLGGSLSLELTDEFAYPTSVASSVHNQVMVGYRLYNSWYAAGLQVFDIDPVTGLLELHAMYDTPGSNWGVYPLLGPGRVLLSDMSAGLLIVSVGAPLGDLDGDGVVGILDFLILLGDWGPCPDPCPPSCGSDLDGDCTVGILDFLILLGNWG